MFKKFLMASAMLLPISAPASAEIRILCNTNYGPFCSKEAQEARQRADSTLRFESIPLAKDGHYYPVVHINGVQLVMLADTGATVVSLTAKDTRAIGIDPQTLRVTGKSNTPNGVRSTASFVLQEIIIGGVVLHNVPASCCVAADLPSSLLGMSVLGQLNVRIADGFMHLTPKKLIAA